MNLMSFPHLPEVLEQSLKAPLPSKEALKMMFPNIKAMPDKLPPTVKESAVMALLFPEDGEWHLLAIRRTEDGHAHSGQIGFPGGRREPEDPDLLTTALRETFEEVGIESSRIRVAGQLSPVYVVVSNFNVSPFVGFIDDVDNLSLSASEVQSVLRIPLRELFAPESKTQTEVVSPAFPDIKRIVNAYRIAGNTIIWGATAIMIAELELVLRDLVYPNP
ncbi:CoA pyrophosphatase [Rurimicrobium arvi]|uniref:CoA pyrophosphatase n=1 Tax=Rurimicrobium arvi TaxID=2049916 RepID=A0ABP8MYF9_9BACT